MTDDRPTTVWWTQLDRGWKAVVLGLLLAAVVQVWHAVPAFSAVGWW